jgi:hypothetical protein
MSKEVAIVFTAQSIETILAHGGSCSWRLDRNHARQCAYVVETRNAYANWVEGPEEHQAAFLIGKVSDVIPSPTHEDRWLITFSEYAIVNISGVWKGDRNPVRYSTTDALTDEFGIDFDKLDWKLMPERSSDAEPPAPATAHKAGDEVQPLTMSQAKKGLALTFGVAPEAIEITVRG